MSRIYIEVAEFAFHSHLKTWKKIPASCVLWDSFFNFSATELIILFNLKLFSLV
jgi:hypothetical protein